MKHPLDDILCLATRYLRSLDLTNVRYSSLPGPHGSSIRCFGNQDVKLDRYLVESADMSVLEFHGMSRVSPNDKMPLTLTSALDRIAGQITLNLKDNPCYVTRPPICPTIQPYERLLGYETTCDLSSGFCMGMASYDHDTLKRLIRLKVFVLFGVCKPKEKQNEERQPQQP